ncbi:MAG TPA: DUF3426 domain-containing protein [Thiotrichales bacterium]|nr:DUF3426 domain-containing protein [Thiotrichales bacterium]
MYTLCPHCSTCFRITTEHLNAADGNVRCGNCGGVFNALDNPALEADVQEDELLTIEEESSLLQEDDIPLDDPWELDDGNSETELANGFPRGDETPQDEDLLDDELWELNTPDEMARSTEVSSLYAERSFPPLGEDAPTDPTPPATAGDHTAPAAKPAIPDLPQATEEELHESYLNGTEDITIEELERLFLAGEPEEKSRQEPLHPLVTAEPEPDETVGRGSALSTVLDNWIVLSAGSLLLILLLLGQYLWYSRDYLAQHYPETRPLLGGICEHLGCKLPLRRDPGRLQITARDVRTHPREKEALLINATFVNRAPFRQPYPLVELKLSNLRGEEIGRRTFLPREYLAGDPDIQAGIPPDGQVYLVLEVMDPGGQAVNFEFNFR